MANTPTITKLTKPTEEFKIMLEKRIKIGQEIYSREVDTEEDFLSNVKEASRWSDYNSEYLKISFNIPNNEYKQRYDNAGVQMLTREETLRRDLTGQKDNRPPLLQLKQQVLGKIEYLEKLIDMADLWSFSIAAEDTSPKAKLENSQKNNNIFIVHGHNDYLKLETARTLEKLGLKPIILHEQINKGKTIIEKFLTNAEVDFAIVLMTSDDVGRAKKASDLSDRARQNVILEMGFFIGRLGREKVFLLYEDGVETPSDLLGQVYTKIDAAGKWKYDLARELQAAGYEVDLNNIW